MKNLSLESAKKQPWISLSYTDWFKKSANIRVIRGKTAVQGGSKTN